MAQDSWNGNGISPTGDGSGDLWDKGSYVTDFDDFFREYVIMDWIPFFGQLIEHSFTNTA